MKRVLLALIFAATPLQAQSAGKTGAQVLQFNAGARAGGLAGAYTAAADADALFYNPAGIANALRGASASYETYSIDVGFGSVAGFTSFGRVSIGVSLAYLDAGSIAEIVPDPEFGGNTGSPTGNSVSANESAGRISFALPLRADRALRIGASLGFVSVGIAEVTQNAAIADFGAQYDVAGITVAAALRNLGGTMSGPGDNPLPTEFRVGATAPIAHITRRFYMQGFVDAIARVREGGVGIVAALEAGLPRAASENQIGAAVRVGYDAESEQLGALRLGAGLSFRTVSLDYSYQSLDLVGAVHRFGLRWTVSPVGL